MNDVKMLLQDYFDRTCVDSELHHALTEGDLMLLAQDGLVAEHVSVIGPGSPWETIRLTLTLPDTPDTHRLLEELMDRR